MFKTSKTILDILNEEFRFTKSSQENKSEDSLFPFPLSLEMVFFPHFVAMYKQSSNNSI